jgi:acetyltransferase-like isoleucine patch superfamily enzyme
VRIEPNRYAKHEQIVTRAQFYPRLPYFMKKPLISPGNQVDIQSELLNSCTIKGIGNNVFIGRNCHIESTIEVIGDNNNIIIGEGSYVKGCIAIIKAQ